MQKLEIYTFEDKSLESLRMKQQQNHHHRMPWTKQEDQALINLKENLRLEKWTDIAQKLSQIYNIQHRNHQHCRDRYVNFLEHRNDIQKWTTQNYDKLIQLYMQLGNKWSQIANRFNNMSGIMIKNKFYSRLRKGTRNMNYLIQTYFIENWEKFNFSIIFKLVNCAANKYDFPPRNIISKRVEQKTYFVEEIIRNIYRLSWMNKSSLKKTFNSPKDNLFNRQNISKLIQQINMIDENMEKKHSNRALRKKSSIKKEKHHIQQSDNQSHIKQESQQIDFQNNEVELKVFQKGQNKIEKQLNQKKILIISTNSYQKVETSIENSHQIYGNSHHHQLGFSWANGVNQRKNLINMKNEKYNKQASYKLIKQEDCRVPQQNRRNGQISTKQTNDISMSNQANLNSVLLLNK